MRRIFLSLSVAVLLAACKGQDGGGGETVDITPENLNGYWYSISGSAGPRTVMMHLGVELPEAPTGETMLAEWSFRGGTTWFIGSYTLEGSKLSLSGPESADSGRSSA